MPRRRREGFWIETDDATSERLAGVRQKGTKPELVVRKILTELGVRYRLNNKDMPGNPDIANRKHRWAIFVHGCFWHRHPGCKKATTPTRNREFWEAKLERNVERDRLALDALEARGYRVGVIWECETAGDRSGIAGRLRKEVLAHDERKCNAGR